MSNGKHYPLLITDNVNEVKLTRENYLGKGGFGRCYTLKNINTGKKYAGKFLDKKELTTHNVTYKIFQEINIHKDLVHDNIVSFKTYIEDDKFIYIILELCENRSMSELIKRRQFVRTFEAKYYMKQVVAGISYLHERRIIHRDLKLANLFINHKMILKIGDFGLAVKIGKGRSNRRSVCGTPNYIAPEVLSRQGHSYAVDVWALGCILYTMLVGCPPFQTETIKETYSLIAKCNYTIPDTMNSYTAADFIKCTLQKNPIERPTIFQLSNHDFLNIGFIPRKLPSSCIVMHPPNKTLFNQNANSRFPTLGLQNSMNQSHSKLDDTQLTNMIQTLYEKLKYILDHGFVSNVDDTQDPSLRPFIWINSWMNYSHKYGFSYRLNDNSVGVLYNDGTTLLVLPSGKNMYYFDSKGCESYFNISDIADHANLRKKMKILNTCKEFIFNSLRNAYVDDDDSDVEPLSSLPILKNHLSNENVVAMFLSNGTLQLNFSVDHIKLILCPIMNAATIITNHGNQFITYQLNLLNIFGCDPLLMNKLKDAVKIMKRILDIRKANMNVPSKTLLIKQCR